MTMTKEKLKANNRDAKIKTADEYISAPFAPSEIKRIRNAARKSGRSAGRYVAWIVLRFMHENEGLR